MKKFLFFLSAFIFFILVFSSSFKALAQYSVGQKSTQTISCTDSTGSYTCPVWWCVSSPAYTFFDNTVSCTQEGLFQNKVTSGGHNCWYITRDDNSPVCGYNNCTTGTCMPDANCAQGFGIAGEFCPNTSTGATQTCCSATSTCVPTKSCYNAPYNCGSFTDSCGKVENCGTCATGSTCSNSSGGTCQTSSSGGGGTTTTVPAPPTGLSAAPFCQPNTTTGPADGFTFSWTGSTGATSYQVSWKVDGTTTWGTTQTTSATSLTYPPASCTTGPGGCSFSYNTLIDWRVAACNSAGCSTPATGAKTSKTCTSSGGGCTANVCTSSTTYQVCTNGQLGAAQNCSSGQTCSGAGVCGSSGSTCTSGTKQCASSTSYQTCTNNAWGTAVNCGTGQTCSGAGVCTTTTPGTVTVNVFNDSKNYSGNPSSAGNTPLTATVTMNGNTITSTNGVYSHNFGTTVPQTIKITVIPPVGYTVDPATCSNNLGATYPMGYTTSVALTSSQTSASIDMGFVTPPSTVQVGSGSEEIKGSIMVDTGAGVLRPYRINDITLQGSGTELIHMETDVNGGFDFTGIPPSDYSYSLSPSMPAGGYTYETVEVKGPSDANYTDLKMGMNPINIAFVAEPANLNQSLNDYIGSQTSGIVYFTGYNILYVDPSKVGTVNIQIVTRVTTNTYWSCSSSSGAPVCTQGGSSYGNGTCENNCFPYDGGDYQGGNGGGYATFAYPNGGAYLTPIGSIGTPLYDVQCGPNHWYPAPGGSSVIVPPQNPCTPTSSNLASAGCTPGTCQDATNSCSGTGTQTCTCNVVGGTTGATYQNAYTCTNAPTTCTNQTLSCINGQCINPSITPSPTPAVSVSPSPTPPQGSSPTPTPTPGGSGSCTAGKCYECTNNACTYTGDGNGIYTDTTCGTVNCNTTHVIFGYVYQDLNGNGKWDPGEGISGAGIEELNGTTVLSSGTTTTWPYNAANLYWGDGFFDMLLKGTTNEIQLNPASLPAGYTVVSPNPVAIANTNTDYRIDWRISNGGVPTPTPIVTAGPTSSPTPTPTYTPGDTVFNFDIGLDGIGSTGDHVTPNESSDSNKNPQHPTRNLTVNVFNNTSATSPVLTKSGSIVYSSSTGRFEGSIDMGNTLSSGAYTIKVTSNGYLTKLVPGIQSLTQGQTFSVPSVNLVAGDINLDNKLDVTDYNILTSCWIYSTNQGACNGSSAFKTTSDLNDDGAVDQTDYNLFLREYSVQNGD